MINNFSANVTKSIDNLNELQKNYEDLQKRVEDLENGSGSGSGSTLNLEYLPIVDFGNTTPSTNQSSAVGANIASLVYEITSYNKMNITNYLNVETDPDGDLSIGLPLILYISIDNKILPLRLRNAWQNEVDNDYNGWNVQEFYCDITINGVTYQDGYLISGYISGERSDVRLELYS